MNRKSYLRASARWLAAGVGVTAPAYGAYVGMTWYRYGEAAPPSPEEQDPLLERFMPALNAFAGGYYGLSGADGVPREWLAGSPFSDYVVPSLVLFVVVGGALALAALMVFRGHPWHVPLRAPQRRSSRRGSSCGWQSSDTCRGCSRRRLRLDFSCFC